MKISNKYYFFLGIGAGTIAASVLYQIIFAFLLNLITLNSVPFLPEFFGAVIGSALSFIFSLWILRHDQRKKADDQKKQDKQDEKNAKNLIINELKIKFNAIKVFEFSLKFEANKMQTFKAVCDAPNNNYFYDTLNQVSSLNTIKNYYSKLFIEIGQNLSNIRFDVINALIANKVFFLLDTEIHHKIQTLQNTFESTSTQLIDLAMRCSNIDAQYKDIEITNKILIPLSESLITQASDLLDDLLNSFEDTLKKIQ